VRERERERERERGRGSRGEREGSAVAAFLRLGKQSSVGVEIFAESDVSRFFRKKKKKILKFKNKIVERLSVNNFGWRQVFFNFFFRWILDNASTTTEEDE
jgi:hypothetical protein